MSKKKNPYIVHRNRIVLKKLFWIGLILAGIIAGDRLGLFGQRTKPDFERFDGKTFTCVHVCDGDTIDIGVAGAPKNRVRIRLWGVDTPETVHPKKPVQYFGPEASAFTKAVTLNKKVKIELVPNHTRGKYGRLLCYVYLPDGTMLNRALIQKGFAYADPRFSHPRKREFLREMKIARTGKIGLWKNPVRKDLPYYLTGSKSGSRKPKRKKSARK